MSVNINNLTLTKGLRNNDKRVGWINSGHSQIKRTERNQVMGPRAMYKDKRAKRFIKNDVMSCVPATRMCVYNMQREFFGHSVMLDDLAPDCIGQIMYEWSKGNAKEELPPHFKDQPRHTWTTMLKHRKDATLLEKFDMYREPDENFLSVPSDNGDELAHLMLRTLREQGGLINYMCNTSLTRPDMVGAVEKTKACKLKYMCYPAQHEFASKGKFCGFCNTPNLFIQADTPNRPLRSKNPHLAVHETCDDYFEYEDGGWEKEDGKWINTTDVAWRCGVCMADLRFSPVENIDDFTFDSVIDTMPYLIGGLLEQLKLTGVTDFYHDLTDAQTQSIIQHDMNIVKRLLTKLWNGRVPIPTNVNFSDVKALNIGMPQFELVRSIRANTSCLELATESNIMTGYMRSLFASNTTTIYGSMSELIDENTKHNNPSTMFYPIRQTETKGYDCCGPLACQLTIHELLSKANSNNGLLIIVPLESGQLNNCKTHIKEDRDKVYWSHNQTNNAIKLNKKTFQALNSDAIKTDNGYAYVLNVLVGNFFKLVNLTMHTAVQPHKFQWVEQNRTVDISLPLPCVMEKINNKLNIGMKVSTFPLNTELFRALCVRNISGQMEFKALAQYAIAFNMRRYTTGKVILKQQHIDYSLINAHVYACAYVMKLQNNRHWISSALNKAVSTENWSSVLLAAINNLHLPLNLDVTNINIEWLTGGSAFMTSGRLPKALTYLHSAVVRDTARNVNVFKVDSPLSLISHFCPHRRDLGRYPVSSDGCLCCGAITSKSFCGLCQPLSDKSVMWAVTFDTALDEVWKLIMSKFVNTKKSQFKTTSTRQQSKRPSRQTIAEPRKPEVTKVAPDKQKLSSLIEKVMQGDIQPVSEIKEVIDNVTSNSVLDACVDYLDPTVLYLSANHDGSIHNMPGCMLHLPFINYEHFAITIRNAKLLENITIPNTDVNSCGFEVINYFSPNSLTLEQFKELVNAEPPFDSTQIFYAAEYISINLLLVVPTDDPTTFHATGIKSDASNNFYTIMYTPGSHGSIGHFSPINIEINSALRYYLCDPSVRHEQRLRFLQKDNKLNLLFECNEGDVEYNLATELALSLMHVNNLVNTVKPITQADYSDGIYITNSDVNDPVTNQYNFRLSLIPKLSSYIVGDSMNNQASVFNEELTVPERVPSDLTELLRVMCVDTVLQIVNARRALLNKSPHNQYFNHNRIVNNGMLEIELTNGYLKPLDEIAIKHKDGSVSTCVVRKTVGSIFYIDEVPTDEKFVVILTKTSISSCIKTIECLQRCNRNGTLLNELLINANCINGYGGTGKTEKILTDLKPTTLVITMTSVAKENIIERGCPAQQCMTLERASQSDLRSFTSVVIDEANMLDYLDLNKLIHPNVSQISMYYDETQISKFDNIKLQGFKVVRKITDYPVNVQKWTNSYRYGRTLATALQELLPDLVSVATHDTTVEFANLSELTTESLLKLINMHNPTVILHAYTHESNEIKKMVNELVDIGSIQKETAPLVAKIHSFQSKQASRVMLIQWRLNNQVMGLCRDRQYVISAATRATDHCVVVSVGHINMVMCFRDSVSSIGGLTTKRPEILHGTLLEMLNNDLAKTAELLNNKLVNQNLKFVVDSNELMVYKSGLYVGKYFKDNDDWQTASPYPTVAERMAKALTMPPGKEHDHDIENEQSTEIAGLSRLRCLLWIVDMVVNDGKLALGSDWAGYYIKKTTGCPFMCGLLLLKGNKTIMYVNSGWTGLTRTVTINSNEPMAAVMRAWLQGEPSNTWLDKVTIPSDVDLNMAIDRAMTLPMATIEYTFQNKTLSPKTPQDNAAWALQLCYKYKLNTRFLWRSAVRHTMIIHKSRLSSPLFGMFYSLVEPRSMTTFGSWSSGDKYASVFNAAISTIKPTMRRKRLIGVNDFGMYLPAEVHIENKTEVGQYLIKSKFQQELRNKESSKLAVSIAACNYEECKSIVQNEKGDLATISHNSIIMTTLRSELFDSYALSKYGTQGMGVLVSYLGFNSHLNPVCNRHYISSVIPSSGEMLVAWNASIKSYEVWHEAFASRMKDMAVEYADQCKKQKANMTDEQCKKALDTLSRYEDLSNLNYRYEHLEAKRDTLIIGSCAMLLSGSDWIKAINNSTVVIAVIPIEPQHGDLMLQTLTPNYNLNPDIIRETGLCTIDQVDIKFDIVDEFAGAMYCLVNLSNKLTVRNIGHKEFQQNELSLQVPTIDLGNVLTGDPIIQSRQHTINKRIMHRCLNYGIANSATLQQLLSYVRSLLSTYDTSRTGIFPTYNTSVEVAHVTAVAAFVIYKLDSQGLMTLTDLSLNNPETTNLLLNLFNKLNKDNNFVETISSAIELAAARINFNLRHIADCIDDVKVKIKVENVNLQFCRPQKVIEVCVNIDDGDSDDGHDDQTAVVTTISETGESVNIDSIAGHRTHSSESGGEDVNSVSSRDPNSVGPQVDGCVVAVKNNWDDNSSVATSSDGDDGSISSFVTADQFVVENVSGQIEIRSMLSTDEQVMTDALMSAHLKSSQFNRLTLTDERLQELSQLWGDVPDGSMMDNVWVYWQPSTKPNENKIVNECIKSLRKIYGNRLIILNNNNEYLYIPKALIDIKNDMTIQCWTDIVRMWLMYNQGGIWFDAAIYVLEDSVNYEEYLTGHGIDGLLYFEQMKGKVMVLENWLIVTKPGTKLMQTWALAFLDIIISGNSLTLAKDILVNKYGEYTNGINWTETYLTMHQASVIATNKHGVSNYVTMSGFTGPLNWIAPNMDMAGWLNYMISTSYRPCGGVVKLINMARRVLAGLDDHVIDMFLQQLTAHTISDDALVIGYGTRGDQLTADRMSAILNEEKISNTLIIVGSENCAEAGEFIQMNENPLTVANLNSIDDVGNSLSFLKDSLKRMIMQINGRKFNWLYANFHVPGMFAVARYVGAIPVQLGGPPLHDNALKEGYFTMLSRYEMPLNSFVNSLLHTISCELDQPLPTTGLHKGAACVTKLNVNHQDIGHQSDDANFKFTVGNIISSTAFEDANSKLTQASINETIDLVLLGPTISKLMLVSLNTAMAAEKTRSNKLLVVGANLSNLTNNQRSTFNNNWKKFYSTVSYVNNINLMNLHNKVGIVYCHGGCGTVSDAISIGSKVISVGKTYDQQYWVNANHKVNIISANEAVSIIHGKGKRNQFFCRAKSMLKNNDMPVQYAITHHNVTYTVTFNPMGPDNCVAKCVAQWKAVHGATENLINLSTKPLMTRCELIEHIASLKLNLNLIEDEGHMTRFELNESWDEISLALIPNQVGLHCVLCDVRSEKFVSGLGPPTKLHVVKPNLENLIEGIDNNQTSEARRLINKFDMTTYMLKDRTWDKFQHMTVTNKLVHRMDRVRDPMKLVTIASITPNIYRVENVELASNKCMVALHKTDAMYIYVLTIDRVSYIITSETLDQQTIMILDVGCSMFKTPLTEEQLRREFKNTYKPLNRRTLDTLRSQTTQFAYSSQTATLGDNLVVCDYDNRGHDKYDERAIINAAEKVIWRITNPELNIKELLDKTYGKLLRVALRNGKVIVQLDSNLDADKYLLACALRHYNIPYSHGNHMISERHLDSDVLDYLHSKYDWLTKPKQRDAVSYQAVMTSEEWCNLLNADESVFPLLQKVMTNTGDLWAATLTTRGPTNTRQLAWTKITNDNLSVVDNNHVYAAQLGLFVTNPKKGGEVFLNEEKISLGNSKDWWKPIGNEEPINKEIEPDHRIQALGHDGTITANQWSSAVTYETFITEEITNDEEVILDMQMETSDDIRDHTIVPHTIQNLWENTDLTMDLRQYAPINAGVVRSKENPDKIKELLKFKLNSPWPLESRPVLTKWVFEDHRSITGRLFSKLYLRHQNKTKPKMQTLREFVEIYFIDGFVAYDQQNQLIDVDAYETALWISKRRDAAKIQSELNDLFTTELGVIPLNAINIHLKLESLLKESPIMHWGQHQARAIYWQRKAIAAISSPIFLKVKTRLKQSLKPKFVYADGCTPGELCLKARTTTGVNWFFENDLSKQDRQTDKPTLDVEMEIYKLLGTSPSVLRWWKTMHEVWRFRSRWNKGYAREMRLTGQSTTSLGNLITNMQVHLEFFKRNNNITKLVLFLGDDMLALMANKPDVSWVPKHTKLSHNMTSKPHLSDVCGLFCCMIAYKNSVGSCDIGPDYTRLKFRFEVTNGVSEASEENVIARCQSYACMIGKTKEMEAIKLKKNWPIPLDNWYDQYNLIPAIASRYDLSEMVVKGHYGELVHMIDNPVIMPTEFKVYTAAKVY